MRIRLFSVKEVSRQVSRAVDRLTISALIPCMVGCAWFGEDSQRASIMAMPEITETLKSARAELASSEQWPQQDWWTVFADPSLNRLIETALAGNPDFKAAEARLRQSQALVDAQAAELYPTLGANVGFSAQRYSANSVQAKFAGEDFRQLLVNPLLLRYHLDFWGQDQAALQAAVGRSLAVAAELADARLLLAATVAAAYFDLRAANDKLALAEHIAADREALSTLEQSRLTNGLSNQEPLLRARMEWHAARQRLAGIRAKIELHKNLLAALAGQGSDWGRTLQVESGMMPQQIPLPTDLPLRLLARRPDLTAARLHAEAAAEEIKVAETAFYPDVNLIAFTGLHSVSLTDILLQGSSLAYAVGPSIELPLFEGGRLRANLSHRQAAYDAAVERYNAGLVHAVQEVADALNRWRELETRLAEQRHSLADAEQNHRLSETLNRTGLGDRAQPLRTRIDENRERLHLLSLEAERRKTAVSIIKALGGGYDKAINARTSTP